MRFRLWAPEAGRVDVVLVEEKLNVPMQRTDDGWHEAIAEARAGTLYRFLLPDGTFVPDPASRFQPEDVRGPSEVIDLESWVWNDVRWHGRRWEEAVIYELHVGLFTPAGTFLSLIDRLDYLVDLGVTAIELMPIADFPGSRNWGYDGVFWYAPDSSYGRPEDLKRLVEAAHSRGLMVFLDVVYNHFGPLGNFLSLYAPQFFNDVHTPWGHGINFESRPVRDFVIQNAIHWIRDYHLDGLRLDAVHAMHDRSSRHVLIELAQAIHELPVSWPVHLIIENEENEPDLLQRSARGQPELYSAQWNDDVHHCLHTAITGEAQGYYAEYHGDTSKLARGLSEGFVFQGENMVYRESPCGQPSGHLPPTAFVSFLQNHDQVGNRAFGDRINRVAEAPAIRAAAAVYLLLPQIPMLLMGEEWQTKAPFPFFCNFGSELGNTVREGRRSEFARFPEFSDPAQRERIPDPEAETSYVKAKLDWDELSTFEHRQWTEWYRRVLRCRHQHVVPLLGSLSSCGASEVFGLNAVVVRWKTSETRELVLLANLFDDAVPGIVPANLELFWMEGGLGNNRLEPWTVIWGLADSDDYRRQSIRRETIPGGVTLPGEETPWNK